MNRLCVFVCIALVLTISCDPTKAGLSRVRRQGWNWGDEAVGGSPQRPPLVQPTPSPAPNQAPDPATLRKCVKDCLTTPQYNPVCGTDNVTYDNEGKLDCARDCGAGNVQIRFRGTCAPL